MRAKQVVVELLPSRIELAVFAGSKCTASRRMPLTFHHEVSAWRAGVVEAAPRLKAIVEQLGLEGAPTTVVYRSPTQSVDLLSLPVKPSEVAEAAKMQCMEALPYQGSDPISRAAVVGRDASGSDRNQHAVAAAEVEETAQCILDFVEQAGLRFLAAVPTNAIMLARLVAEVVQDKKTLTGRLYVGEQNSYFLVAERGRLVFARQISIGVDTMVTSLTRPVRKSAEETVQLTMESARPILFEHGRPARDVVVDTDLGIRGDQVGPMLQTVLQRFVVELRQSLRFGLSAEQRESLEVEVSGPGSVIPTLAGLLGDELSVRIGLDDAYDKYDSGEVGGPGSQMRDIAARRPLIKQLNLQTGALTRIQNTKRLTRWMWAGAVVAVGAIAADAFRHGVHLDEIQKEAAALRAQDSGAEAQRETRSKLVGVVQSLNDMEHLIEEEVGSRPDYRAILQELSRQTMPSIRLSSITVNRNDDHAGISLGGFAFQDESTGESELQTYIERLDQSPLFGKTELGSVQMVTIAGRPCQNFRATLETLATPPPASTPIAAVEDQP